MLPNFSLEKKLAKQGYKFIGGVDEVGRGCFAGPVVAGCVIFESKGWVVEAEGVPSSDRRIHIRGRRTGRASNRTQPLINDSKKLSPKQRELADKWIRKNAHAFGIGKASVAQINRIGIKKATEIAFRKAIKDCEVKVDYLLIDAFYKARFASLSYIPYVRGLKRKNQKAIVKGDTESVSIAAASIVAKVYRDKLMTALAKQPKLRKYKWHKNKGYGTKDHQKAILNHGVTKHHRKKFVETFLSRKLRD